MSTFFQVLIVGSLGLGHVTGSLAQNQEFADKRVVHLLQEPRHRTVLKREGLFLLDVQINPWDVSLPHTHNQAILLTYISDEDGPRYGEIRSVMEYVDNPLTHEVSNPGPGLLHIIALVNDGHGVSADTQDEPIGLNTSPTIENNWFRAYRIELGPGEATQLQIHQNPTAIVQATPGLLHVTRADGISHELDRSGDWAWREANSPFMIRNLGDTGVIIAINEGRRTSH